MAAAKTKFPLSKTQLLVLDPDAQHTSIPISQKCITLAYLSVGEAEEDRAYWPRISSATFLIEQGKSAENHVRVDFRDPAWQSLLLDVEIPRLLQQKQYDGLYLDTLDSIPYLEHTHSERYRGMRNSLDAWLRNLRQRYPNLILLAKGTEGLEIAAPHVDGYVSDGLFATWDADTRRYRKTSQDEQQWRLAQIENAKTQHEAPVFTIEYVDPAQPTLAHWAWQESKKQDVRPFITDHGLSALRVDLNDW